MLKSIYNQTTVIICFSILLVIQGCQPASEGVKDGRNSASDEQPNMIVILVDDLRWDEFGAAGHNYLKTPNIDRLANGGVYFQNSFTTMPLCSPSRAGLLTGQYAHKNGITDNLARNSQSHQLETFPKMLKQEGYRTAFIGKWHMGNDDSPRPGFSHWVGLKGQGEAIDPYLNINGIGAIEKGYTTDILTQHSIDFINQDNSAPFLLYLSHKALHPNILQRDDGSSVDIDGGGFIAADRHKGMYENEIFQRRPNSGVTPDGKPMLLREIGDLPDLGAKTITKEKVIRERAEMLMAIDDGLGTLMDNLEKNGQLNNTVIVLISDHGFWYGEHGLGRERRLAYEESIRIPFIISYPDKIKTGRKPMEMALTLDLAPTMLELAGVNPPTTIQGRSLVPILENKATDWRSSFLIEYFSDTVFPRIYKMGYKAVRTERYKFIHYYDVEGVDELYDLENDPYELTNIIDESESVTVLAEMKKLMNKHLIETGGPTFPGWD